MKKLLTRKSRTTRNETKKLLTQKSRTARKKRKAALVGRVHPRLARHGGLTYLEIPALDVLQSAQFYTKVLGWLSRGGDPSQGRFSDPTGHLIGRFVVGRVAREPGILPFVYVDHIH